jgi:PHD/YefM family antitoxin component YafN of YafNO toxin-antitoxin module
VVICRHNREVAVLVSVQDYQELRPMQDAKPSGAIDEMGEREAVLSMGEQVLAELLPDEDSGG